jgi:hypothetical protein
MLIAPFVLKSNWEFQRALVTQSPEWGLIWRGDYAIADLAARHLINRTMCWEGADGSLLWRLQSVSASRRCGSLCATTPTIVRPEARPFSQAGFGCL